RDCRSLDGRIAPSEAPPIVYARQDPSFYVCKRDLRRSELATRRPLRPRQHSTPGEGEEGPGILAPFFPARCQVSQLFGRCNPVARDGGAQFLIPAFRGSIAGEGHDPISRPVADIVGKRFNAAEPGLLKEPA